MTDYIPHQDDCPKCGRTYLRDYVWKKLCIKCYLKTKPDADTRLVPGTPAPIETTMLKRLIQLCHPDRHGNSEASNTATAWLLSLRGGQHG